jgi:outer membrane protein insertion porin family
MKFSKLLPVLSLLSSSATFAAVIKDIDIEGLKRFSKDTVLTYAAIAEGDDLDQTDMTQIVSNLFLTDFFDDIQVQLSPEQHKLKIILKEKPVLFSVEFSGQNHFSKSDIEKALTEYKIDKGRTFNERQLQNMIRELQSMYAVDGYYEASLIPTIQDLGDGKIGLKINIEEGSTARIQEINFHGNQMVSSFLLRDIMNLKSASLLAFITSADKYSEYKLENDLILLQNYYKQNGFPYMKVTDKKVTLTGTKKGLLIDIFINEGDQKTISKITNQGTDLLDLKDVIVPQIPFLFDQKQLDDYEVALRNALNTKGYIYGEVKQELIPIDDDQLEVRFVVIPGELFRIHRYNFSGNTTTKEKIIRNFITRPEGAVYSSSDLKALNQDLERTGLFSQVQLNPKRINKTEVDIDVFLQEDKTKKLFATGGASNIGYMWNLGYEDRNIFGTGTKTALKIESDTYESSIQVSLSNPYLTHKNIEGYFNFDRIKRSYQNKFMFFKQDRDIYSTTVGANWSVSSHTRFGINANYFIEKDLNTTEVADDPGEQIIAHYVFTGVKLFRNLFNKYVLPDDGYRWELFYQASLPLGDYTYGDTGIKAQYYVNLGRSGFIFYQNFNARFMFPFGVTPKNVIPSTRLLSCGGADDIRGYHFNSIGPEIESTTDGVTTYKTIGGNIKFSLKSELIIPNKLLNIDYDQIRFSLFLDAAQLWRTVPVPAPYTQNGNSYVPASGIRLTTGLALRFVSQILPPISMSVNYPLIHQQRDKIKYEYFSFGSQMEF